MNNFSTAFIRLQFVLLISLCVCLPGYSQNIPTKVKDYLDKQYAGWKMKTLDKANCGDLQNIASGDFNGDRQTDFVLRIFRGKRSYILALIRQRNTFKTAVLHSGDINELLDTGVYVMKRGEKHSLGKPGEENAKYIRLKNDSPGDAVCESDVGGIHIYKNGQFVEY